MEKDLLPAVIAELNGDGNPLAKLLNSLSLVKQFLGEGSWVGLYVFDEQNNILKLGPFQGSPACETIHPGRGVVGACYTSKRALYVKDVSTFPGYISCDPVVKSEAVWPLMYNEQVTAVLDIDSPKLDGLKEALPILDQFAALLTQYSPSSAA
jgi:L-methionine (R)-S-oxide reductase